MSAREVMPPKRSPMDDPAYSTCIANLHAAGYVILSPDEVRGIRDEALEEAAKIAGDLSEQEDGAEGWLAGSSIASAIRSLKGGRDA